MATTIRLTNAPGGQSSSLLEKGSGPSGLQVRLEWPKIDPDYGGAEITAKCQLEITAT